MCWVSCAPTETPGTTKAPFVKLSCQGHKAEGFFVDAQDPTIFHQCSHGQHIATFHCRSGTIFNETEQVCVVKVKNDVQCPERVGLFPYPGNPHKFISCDEGHANVEPCAADLVFDPVKKECVYNDQGLTWPTDVPTGHSTHPTVATVATKAGTTERGTTERGTTGGSTKEQERSTTGGTKKVEPSTTVTPKPECVGKEHTPDPEDKHKYFICHNGKKLHEVCPEDLEFDPVEKRCG